MAADTSEEETRGVDREASARWSGLAVGLGFAAFLGMFGVVMYLVMRRRDEDLARAIGEQVSKNLPHSQLGWGLPMLGGQGWQSPAAHAQQVAQQVLPTQVAQATSRGYDSALRTVGLSATSVNRVMTAAGPNPWHVRLRVVGQPGSSAAFATDQSRLRNSTSAVGEEAVVVPSGGEMEFRLNPRQVLFGIGSTSNVNVSVAATEILPSAAPLSIVRG